jgi:hypothetical protein
MEIDGNRSSGNAPRSVVGVFERCDQRDGRTVAVERPKGTRQTAELADIDHHRAELVNAVAAELGCRDPVEVRLRPGGLQGRVRCLLVGSNARLVAEPELQLVVAERRPTAVPCASTQVAGRASPKQTMTASSPAVGPSCLLGPFSW